MSSNEFMGMLIGAIVGILAPQAAFMNIFGNIFVGALKAIAPILVFVLIISSLASAGKGVGKQRLRHHTYGCSKQRGRRRFRIPQEQGC